MTESQDGNKVNRQNHELLVKQMLLESNFTLSSKGATSESPLSSQIPRMTALLQSLNVLPLLARRLDAQDSQFQPVLRQLFKQLMLPNAGDTQSISQWLRQRPADQTLASLLTILTNQALSADDTTSTELKAMLMLTAEKRIAESPRDGQFHWVLPVNEPTLPPIEIRAYREQKHDTRDEEDEQAFCIKITLPMNNGALLVAAARLDKSSLSLDFQSSNNLLTQKVQKAVPVLEQVLAGHNIVLGNVNVETKRSAQEPQNVSGISIKV